MGLVRSLTDNYRAAILWETSPCPMKAFCLVGIVLASAVVALRSLHASEAAPALTETKSGQFVFRLLPKTFQQNPTVDVTVVTDLTGAGRPVRRPTASRPAYYIVRTVGYHDAGQGIHGERPVPVEVLRGRLEQALAEAHYLPSAGGHPASLVIFFVWGSSNALDESASVDGPLDPTNSTDDDHRALLDRAALIGGDRFAAELEQVLARDDAQKLANIDGPSPLEAFASRDFETRRLIDQAGTDCFYVVASAYDAAELGRGRKVLLWRTKMTTPAQGVAMAEALPRLMVAGAPFFGADMPRAVTMTGHLMPEGNVEVGPAVPVTLHPETEALPGYQGSGPRGNGVPAAGVSSPSARP
jgi:hypothetical protein